jgi:hypothetical protein
VGNSSQSLPLFEKSCKEALSLLSGDTSDRALAFSAEAHDLLATLDRWKQDLPTSENRAAVISRVLDLNRAVMEHRTTTRTAPPPGDA